MSTETDKYEFGGPLGSAAIIIGLPALLFTFAFVCNDISGCPAPFLLNGGPLSWARIQAETGWPGLAGLFDVRVIAAVLGYYLFSLVLWRVLPAHEVSGLKLAHHDKALRYRFNALSSTAVHLLLCAAGTYLQGADFVVWTFISENYVQILAANFLIASLISVFVYVRSFSVDTRYPNASLRELSPGGDTGNVLYDFFIGRELNPRVSIPWIGEVDLKVWLEFRPGLTGWLLLDLAFAAQQYRTYGYVSSAMALTAGLQGWYVLDSHWLEAGILTMMDTTTDGLGFMLTFGDIVWVPFLYSTMCRYLAVHPVQLGAADLGGMVAVFLLGFYIFRSANRQRHVFRRSPEDPAVKDLPFLRTKRGTRLLTGGWWGTARHINYLGDWLQAVPFCMPTGLAGYTVVSAGAVAAVRKAGEQVFTMADGRGVVQGAARGWAVPITYFYAVYFAVLLIHRERRDDARCLEKYGDDWAKYKSIVRWRILPGVY